MPFSIKHLVSTKQLSREDADSILGVAQEMEEVLKQGGDERLRGKILANLFYEPSTRTRLSFATAMQRLGGSVISAEGVRFSSFYKGESLEDMIIVVGQYADIICMRHPEEGSADRAEAVSLVPFINAGDGPGQHPTQALLDLYTIQKERKKIEGLSISMVGDLKFGRTVHSLCFLLGLYPDIQFTFISPKELLLPSKVTSFLQEKKLSFRESENLEDGLDADVIYMTRVQQERFEDPKEYERLKLMYILEARHLKGRDITVVHPLPRVGEIATDVDPLPNAAYFRQVRNGVPLRMALLAMLLEKA